jgi:hypothetical protein
MIDDGVKSISQGGKKMIGEGKRERIRSFW